MILRGRPQEDGIFEVELPAGDNVIRTHLRGIASSDGLVDFPLDEIVRAYSERAQIYDQRGDQLNATWNRLRAESVRLSGRLPVI